MAKAVSGGAVGILRGSIGDTTYRLTRHGQVVQRKPIPPVHTSQPAQDTKDAFRAAAFTWQELKRSANHLYNAFLRTAEANGQTKTQAWFSAYAHLLASHEWVYPATWNISLQPVVRSYRISGPDIVVSFYPDTVDQSHQVASLAISHWTGSEPTMSFHIRDVSPDNEITFFFNPGPFEDIILLWNCHFFSNSIHDLGGSTYIHYD